MTETGDVSSCAVTARLLRRNWLPPAAGIAVAASGIGAMLFGPAPRYHYEVPPAAPFGLLAAILGLAFAGLTIARSSFPRERLVTVRASRTELAIEGHAPIAVDEIEGMKCVWHCATEYTVASLTTRDRLLVLRMRAADAVTLARVLDSGIGARRSAFGLAMPYGKRFIGVFILMSAFTTFVLGSGPGAAFRAGFGTLLVLTLFVTPISLIAAWLAGVHTGRLVIAADGISVRWFLRERFIPFTDVVGVRRVIAMMDGGIPRTIVRLKDKREVVLRVGDMFVARRDCADEGEALYSHLRGAFDSAIERRGEAQAIAPLLARGDGGATEWLARLDALVHGGDSRYRVAAPAPEMLAAVVRDASSSVDVRVGAAAALARLDESGRRAVRVTANCCAEPVVRKALMDLSDAGLDDAFAEILERASKATKSLGRRT